MTQPIIITADDHYVFAARAGGFRALGDFPVREAGSGQVLADTPNRFTNAHEVINGHSVALSFANQGEGTAAKCLSPLLPEKFA